MRGGIESNCIASDAIRVLRVRPGAHLGADFELPLDAEAEEVRVREAHEDVVHRVRVHVAHPVLAHVRQNAARVQSSIHAAVAIYTQAPITETVYLSYQLHLLCTITVAQKYRASWQADVSLQELFSHH